MAMAATRVLIADGQPLVADALAIALRRCGDLEPVASRAHDAVEAIEAARLHRPDVAVIDFWLPGMECAAVIQAVTAAHPRIKVITLSWLISADHIRSALTAGAAGVLPKTVLVADLAEAIRRAHAGDSLVFGDDLAELVETLGRRRDVGWRIFDGLKSLGPREFEVLSYMGDGLPVEDIAARLAISPKTVRNHIHSILSKLGARTQLEAVVWARNNGLIGDQSRRARPGQAPGP